MWRPILIFAGVSLVVAGILGFQLGNLNKGVSTAEHTYITSIDSGAKILKDPVYIVHKLPTYTLFKLKVHNIAAYRAISALIATLAIVSCFFILREWYTIRVAIIGSWLFLTSAWVLHIGRMANPEASYLLLMPVLWIVIWLYTTTLRKSALFVLSLFLAICTYIPGFGWLFLIAGIWKHKLLWAELKEIPWWFRLICVFVVMGALLPLFVASIVSPRELLLIAGLPVRLPTWSALVSNMLSIPQMLIINGPNNPTMWLGRLPILDAFSFTMFVLGLYSLRFQLKLVRIQLLASSSIVLALLITLGGLVTITALMPIIYVLIATGIAFMLQQWFIVFPHNPIARTIATTLMSLIVLLVSFYHINHYFIAWPQTPATKTGFSQSLLK